MLLENAAPQKRKTHDYKGAFTQGKKTKIKARKPKARKPLVHLKNSNSLSAHAKYGLFCTILEPF